MTDYKVKEVTRWEGDPAVYMDADGSYLVWRGGQSNMDAGLENAIKITLFTQPGWCGNYLLPNEEEHVGSDYEQSLQDVPITPSNLANSEAIGEAALAWLIPNVLKEVSVELNNPSGTRLETLVKATRPDGTVEELLFSKYGTNWTYQVADPAYGRELDGS